MSDPDRPVLQSIPTQVTPDRRSPDRPTDEEFFAESEVDRRALIITALAVLLVGIGIGIPIGYWFDRPAGSNTSTAAAGSAGTVGEERASESTQPAPLRTVKVDKGLNFHGLRMTVTRVEFHAEQTLLHVSVTNDSESAARPNVPRVSSGGIELAANGSGTGAAATSPVIAAGDASPGVLSYSAAPVDQPLTIELAPSLEGDDAPFLDEPMRITIPARS